MVILAALFCLFFALFLRPINWITVKIRYFKLYFVITQCLRGVSNHCLSSIPVFFNVLLVITNIDEICCDQ